MIPIAINSDSDGEEEAPYDYDYFGQFLGTRNQPPAERINRSLLPEEPDVRGEAREAVPAGPSSAAERDIGFEELFNRMGRHFPKESLNRAKELTLQAFHEAMSSINEALGGMQGYTDSTVLPALKEALNHAASATGKIMIKIGDKIVPMSIELVKLLVTNPDFIVGALFAYYALAPEFDFYHFQKEYGDFPVFIQRAVQGYTNLLKVVGSGFTFRSYVRDLIPFMNMYFGTFIFNCLVLVFHNVQVAKYYMRERLEYAAHNMFNARFLEYIPAAVNLFNVLQNEVRREIENPHEIPQQYQVVDVRNPYLAPRDVRTLSVEEAPYFEYIHGGPPVLPRGPAAQPQEPAAQPQEAPPHRVPPFSGLNDVPLPLPASSSSQDPRIARAHQQRQAKQKETPAARTQRERLEKLKRPPEEVTSSSGESGRVKPKETLRQQVQREVRKGETLRQRVQREVREEREGQTSGSDMSLISDVGAGRFPTAKPLVSISEHKQVLPYLDINNDYQTFH